MTDKFTETGFESDDSPEQLLNKAYSQVGETDGDAIRTIDEVITLIDSSPFDHSPAVELEARLLKLTLLFANPIEDGLGLDAIFRRFINQVAAITELPTDLEQIDTESLLRIATLQKTICEYLEQMELAIDTGKLPSIDHSWFLGIWESFLSQLITTNEMIAGKSETLDLRYQSAFEMMTHFSQGSVQRRMVGEYEDITSPIPLSKLEEAVVNLEQAYGILRRLEAEYPDPFEGMSNHNNLVNIGFQIPWEYGRSATTLAGVYEHLHRTLQLDQFGDWQDLMQRGVIPLRELFNDIDAIKCLTPEQVISLEYSLGNSHFLLGEMETAEDHLTAVINLAESKKVFKTETILSQVERAQALLRLIR